MIMHSLLPAIIARTFGNVEVLFEDDPGIFCPTTTSEIIATKLPDLRQQTVLDLGCGCGVLAIVAALKGARHVTAVDIMPGACSSVRRNAILNNVSERISIECGDLFDPVASLKFDFIIDDVSGVADDVARISSWFPPSVPAGGSNGSEHVVRMLSTVVSRLEAGGTLCFPVLSLSNEGCIMEAAHGAFGTKIEEVAFAQFPFNEKLKAHLDLLSGLREQGIINFVTKRNRNFWELRVYHAWKS